jgi:hypothetical protein
VTLRMGRGIENWHVIGAIGPQHETFVGFWPLSGSDAGVFIQRSREAHQVLHTPR